MKRIALSCAFAFLGWVQGALAQDFAVKTNFAYWATTTPNISAELAVNGKHTIELTYGLNPWKQSGGDHTSFRHWVLMPEWRHWFCQKFNGWFVGINGTGGEFNMGGLTLPFGLAPQLKDHRYEGWFVGGGLDVGYHWVLSRHWNFEAAIGAGYDYIQYDKYKCGTCGEQEKSGHTHYVGPTKAALSLVYLF